LRWYDPCTPLPASLKPAAGESDTGVFVSINTEDECVTSSLPVPSGVHSLSINPLNWRTDSEQADRSLNLGACFMNGRGEIVREVPAFSGAWIDPARGTIKMADVNPDDFRTAISIAGRGIYHV